MTFALVAYNNCAKVCDKINNIITPTIAANKGDCELILLDNSERPIINAVPKIAIPFTYLWNGGENKFYAGGLNTIVKLAKNLDIVYICTNHGKMYDPSWIIDLTEPLKDKNVGMTGHWEHQHIQGGVFAARTEVLKKFPYSPFYPHLFSDVKMSENLIQNGFTLTDVPSVISVWRSRVQDHSKYKFVHDG